MKMKKTKLICMSLLQHEDYAITPKSDGKAHKTKNGKKR